MHTPKNYEIIPFSKCSEKHFFFFAENNNSDQLNWYDRGKWETLLKKENEKDKYKFLFFSVLSAKLQPLWDSFVCLWRLHMRRNKELKSIDSVIGQSLAFSMELVSLFWAIIPSDHWSFIGSWSGQNDHLRTQTNTENVLCPTNLRFAHLVRSFGSGSGREISSTSRSQRRKNN